MKYGQEKVGGIRNEKYRSATQRKRIKRIKLIQQSKS